MSKRGYFLVPDAEQPPPPLYEYGKPNNNAPPSAEKGGMSGKKLCFRLFFSIILAASLVALALSLYATLKPVGLDEGPLLISDPPPPGPTKKRTVFAQATRRMSWSPRSNIISSTATVFTLEYPEDLSEFVGQRYLVYSNTSLPHQVVFTAAANTRVRSACPRQQPPTWDEEGLYPVARFIGSGAEDRGLLHWVVPECGRVTVIQQRHVEYCTRNLQTCVLPPVASANISSLFAAEVSAAHAIIANLSAHDLASLRAVLVNLTASSINTTELHSTTIVAQTVTTVTGLIDTLFAGNGQFGSLNSPLFFAFNGTVNNLYSFAAEIQNLFAQQATITNLTSQMISSVPLTHTTSGALPSTHNLQLLNGTASAINMTLPADMTAFVGKRMKVCSLSGRGDALLMSGSNRWTSDPSWSIVRFDATGRRPCCLTFDVLSASLVDIVERTCDGTVFCASSGACFNPSTVAVKDAAAASDVAYPTYRDPLSTHEVMEWMRTIYRAFYQNDTTVAVTIAKQDWTGTTAYPAFSHLPMTTVRPGTMTGDEFAETMMALTLTLYRTVNHNERGFGPSTPIPENDIDQAGAMERDSRAVHAFNETVLLFKQMEASVVSINNGETYMINGKNITVDRFFGFRLVVNMFISLTNHWSDPNIWIPFYQFNDWYSGTRHKGLQAEWFPTYRVGVHIDAASAVGRLNQARSSALNLFGNGFKNVLLITPDVMKKAAALVQLQTEAEQAAFNNYFYTGYIYNISGAAIFNDAVDPEGYARAPDQTPTTWANTEAWTNIYKRPAAGQPDNSYYANFTQMNLTSPTGTNTIFHTGLTTTQAVSFTIPQTVARYFPSDEAKRLLDKMEYAYDTYLGPAVRKYGEAVLNRTSLNNQLVQDHYLGKWRSKMQYVSRVGRNHVSYRSIWFEIPCNATIPTGAQLRIPFNSTFNSVYAANNTCGLSSSAATTRFVTAQNGIIEMERWLTDNLEVSVDAHVGDTYLVLRKNNTNLGFKPGQTPYANIDEILFNYVADDKIVRPYGQPDDLPDLVAESGYALADFFVDVQEFLGERLVKENFAAFNFTNNVTAGIYKNNTQNVQITRAMTNAFSTKLTETVVSDVEYLGRHYGYFANGTIGFPGETFPTASSGAGSRIPYKYYPFDYIYRQHYATNGTGGLLRPQDVYDSITGKYKYQFTDSNDTARRTTFLGAYNNLETLTAAQLQDGRTGTFFRWRLDWVMQKVARFIVNTAVQKGLLKDSFIQTYFNSTLIDTNDPSTIAATGPERCVFRVYAQQSGSANSGGGIDTTNKFFNITIRESTFTPGFSVTSELGTLLHEGALGHGFDRVPNAINILRGTPEQRIYLSQPPGQAHFVSDIGTGTRTRATPLPSYGSLAEGWATLGEILGIQKELYVKFDVNGNVIPTQQDTGAALNGIISLARIAARQVLVVTHNYARYAGSFNRMLGLFKDLTGFSTAQSVGFMDRFSTHPTQQASYANGFIVNVGLMSFLKTELALENYTFSQAKFIEFRILRTDYIVGGSLFEIARQNKYAFAEEISKKKRDGHHQAKPTGIAMYAPTDDHVIERRPLPEPMPEIITLWDESLLD